MLMSCSRGQSKSTEELPALLQPESPVNVPSKTFYSRHQLKGMKQEKREPVREFVRRINTLFVEMYGLRDYPDEDFNRFRRGVKKDTLLRGLRRSIWREFHSSYLFDMADEEDVSWSELIEAVQNAEWVVNLMRHLTMRYVNPPVAQEQLTYPFHIDRDGFVRVYVAGFCSSDAEMPEDFGCVAGIGVWFSRNHKLNLSEPLDDRDQPSNNAASLRAAIEAVKMAKAWNVGRVCVCTNSRYLWDSVHKCIFQWLDNGWRRSSGKPVKHTKQWKELLLSAENLDMSWKFVNEGNYIHGEGISSAECLAREAADRYATSAMSLESRSDSIGSISADSLE